MHDRIRAEPTHRLDRFTQWSRETIANSKREGGTGSPPQHASLTPKKVKKEGE